MRVRPCCFVSKVCRREKVGAPTILVPLQGFVCFTRQWRGPRLYRCWSNFVSVDSRRRSVSWQPTPAPFRHWLAIPNLSFHLWRSIVTRSYTVPASLLAYEGDCAGFASRRGPTRRFDESLCLVAWPVENAPTPPWREAGLRSSILLIADSSFGPPVHCVAREGIADSRDES